MESGNVCVICGSATVNTLLHRSSSGSGAGTVKSERTSPRKAPGLPGPAICGSVSDSDHVSTFCKLLRLSSNCSLRLKKEASTADRLFCPDCTSNLSTITQVFEEIQKLQKQIEDSKTEVESHIKQCHQRRKVTRSTKSSVADNLRAFIVQDLGNAKACTQNFSTRTQTRLHVDHGPVGADIDDDMDIGNDPSYDPFADSEHGSHIEGDHILGLDQNLEQVSPEFRLRECMVDLSSVKLEAIEGGALNLPSPPRRRHPRLPRPRKIHHGRKEVRRNTKARTQKRISSDSEDYQCGDEEPSEPAEDFPVKGKGRKRPRRKRSGSPRPRKVKIQKPKGPFACSECPSIFQKEQSLQYHYNKNHGMTQFATYCTTCGKRFYSQRSLETHLEVQGGSCRKEQIPDLVTVPLEHGTMNFKCNLCGLGSRNRRIMQTHAAKHTGVKNFICQICGDGLKTQQSLKQHMLSQHPDSDPSVPHPFACTHPGCGKTMGNPQQFRFHMKKHRNEFDFQCEHCDYKTAYPSCFKTHVDSVHKQLRPYQCRHCAQTFKKSTQMQKHIYSKHTAPEDRPFKCATCGKTFSDKFNLGRHEIIHTGLKPIVCNLCGKRFAVDDYLRIHMKTHKQKYSSKKIQPPASGGQSLVNESGSPEETIEEPEKPEILVDLNAQPVSHVVVFAHKTCS